MRQPASIRMTSTRPLLSEARARWEWLQQSPNTALLEVDEQVFWLPFASPIAFPTPSSVARDRGSSGLQRRLRASFALASLDDHPSAREGTLRRGTLIT